MYSAIISRKIIFKEKASLAQDERFWSPSSPPTGCWRSSCPVRHKESPIWPAGECCVCWASSCSSSAGSWWLGHLPSVRTPTGSWLSSMWAIRPMGCSSACACWIAGTTWWLSVSLASSHLIYVCVHTAVRKRGFFEVFVAWNQAVNLFGTMEFRGGWTRREKSEWGWWRMSWICKAVCLRLHLATSPNVDINLRFSMLALVRARRRGQPATHHDRGENKRCSEEFGSSRSGFCMLVCIWWLRLN